MKKAILTGASSGLGRSLALELANHGYHVALVGRNEAALHAVVKETNQEAQSFMKVVPCDLTEDRAVSSLVSRCHAALGESSSITHLIHCAGYAVTGRVEDIPEIDFLNCWKVNFLSAVSLARQVLPQMRAAGTGVISHIGSGVARRALPYISPYCSAKAALLSFTDSLRVELAESGIKVLYFSPGPVESGFHTATIHRGSSKLAFPPFHGVDAGIVASKLFQTIEAEKPRAVLGMKATVAHHLNYWIPAITDRIVGRLYKIEASSSSHPTSVTSRHTQPESKRA